MTDAEKYLFDLQGFIVIRDAIPPDLIAALNQGMDRLEHLPDDRFPPPMWAKRSNGKDLYVPNITENGAAFEELIDHPSFLPYVAEIVGSPFVLNHAYAIFRYGGDITHLHLGNTPVHPPCQFRYAEGKFYSSLTKVVIGLTDQEAEDGCFAAVPGSHKSNFPNPFGSDPRKHPALMPVPTKAGDVMIFTEATTHGSTENRSGKPRRTLYYAYSVDFMAIWPGYHFQFSPALRERLPASRRQLLSSRWGVT